MGIVVVRVQTRGIGTEDEALSERLSPSTNFYLDNIRPVQ